MTNTISRYNIHGFCTVDILDRSGRAVQTLLDVQSRYQCFRVEHDPDTLPDLRIVIGGFKPDLAGCTVLDNAWWLREGYLYHSGETYKMGARWSFDISGLDGGILELRIAANWLGRPFIAGKIIDAFLFFLLLQHGCSLLHASAVARDGAAYIFAARGGGGKTTFALAGAFEHGMHFMGDNFVILKDGIVYSYLSDLNMFGYNLHPLVWDRLTKFERLRFRLWALVHRLTLGYIKVFSAVSPLRFLAGSLCESAPLRRLSLMKTCDGYSTAPLSRENLIRSMISNMKLEFFSFVRHTAAYACRYPESDLARVWDAYTNTLNANLPEQPFYLITVPEHISDDVKAQALAVGTGKDGVDG